MDGEVDGGAVCGRGLQLGDEDVDEVAFEGSAACGEDRLGDEGVGDGRGGEVGTALEAVAGVGVDEVTARAGADGCGVEPGGLDEDVSGFGGDHGIPAAHDAGEAEGFEFVGDDQVVWDQGAGGAVEELDLFAGVGLADDDAAFNLVDIEGVGGMAHAEQDEVGGVDGVGDWLLAEGREVFGDRAFAGGDGDVADDLRGEASAEGGLFDADRVGFQRGSARAATRCRAAAAQRCRWRRPRGRCRSGSWRRRGWW